jgi:hypothetical protein
MQQDLVDLSLLNAISIAKLNSISIKAKSNSAKLIDLPTSQRKAKIHVYDGSSQNESSCASLLAARAKSQSEVQRHVKFIVELISEGARNAPTIFQTFSSTGSVMPSCIHQLIVKLTPNTDSEGVLAQENILNATGAILTSEGARVPTSWLIVIYSKKSLPFCEDCRMFCVGEGEEQSQQPKQDLVDHYLSFLDNLIGLVDLVKIDKPGINSCNGLIAHISIVGQVGLVGLIDLGLVGHPGFGLVGYTGLGLDGISLVGLGFLGVNGLISVVNLVDHISLLVGQISLVNPIGLKLISHFCLNSRFSILDFIGHNGLIGFIDVGVSFIGLSLNSLGGLIGHIRLVGRCIIGLIKLAVSSNLWPISLIGVIGLCLIVSSSSIASLARRLISFVGLIGSSTHRLFCERLATAVNEATKITWRLKQAAALGVATLRLSATKTAASTYYFTVSSLLMHSLVREKMWWWLALARKKMWRWIASFGKSYNGDVLQYAKQLFSLRLPQMTKYCVMRECDNIHPWISTTGDLAFSHLQEFTVLNSQKGFQGSLPEISLFSLSSLFY